ncbi:S-norcoclaurine synthase [Thalictrum thalictroides]|uniref:S-norcoclaurine synthase n=1 Tax=Thalictrum thalictroides TaxID=46969 RepID=A0A7J6WQW6_THATH|nr:S-norcoclaurine synthase [Thalictrum thalictroides]
MSGSLKDLGGSLPVANVQDLATKELKDIPNRYVRPELESNDVVPIDNSIEIPVFDLSKLLDQEEVGNSKELAKFHSACKDWGFFQLSNHGVPEEIIEKMKSDTMEFFNLPLEEKKAYGQIPNNIEGYGQAFVASEEQKLDWGDMHFLTANPLINRDMRFWPTTPISFRETMDKYTKELRKVTISLIGAFIVNIGDVLEIMSNGIYKSIEHRVVINPDKERLSIAAFHDAEFGTIMGPLPDLFLRKMAQPYDKAGNSGKKTLLSQEDLENMVGSNIMDMQF